MNSNFSLLGYSALLGKVALIAVVGMTGCNQAQPTAASSTLDAQPVQLLKEPVALAALNVGTREHIDMTVKPQSYFAPADPLIVSVSTRGVAEAATIRIALTFQDSQKYADMKQTVQLTGPRITNFKLARNSPWPIGRYMAEVWIDGKRITGQPVEVVEKPPNT